MGCLSHRRLHIGRQDEEVKDEGRFLAAFGMTAGERDGGKKVEASVFGVKA